MITILCSGTRGDVQPYLSLAQRLSARGLSCRIAANRDFTGFVRGYGVDFHPIDVDFASLGVDPEMVRQAQRADNVLKMWGSFRKMREYGARMLEAQYEACRGSEAIVYHPGLTVGAFAARQWGIPGVLATPFPLHRTTARASVVLYGKVPDWGPVNRLSYNALQGMLWMASDASLAPFLRRNGGLPRNYGPPFEAVSAEHPAVVSCSQFVFPKPDDWSPHVHQSGYWFVDEPTEYQPSADLVTFLAAGPAPVYLGFGSMFDPTETETVGRAVVQAVRAAGLRAVINGMPGLELGTGEFAIHEVPHSWLFPRMAAVCHHGGAGTAAAAFRAGVPQVVVPFALDQFAWARRAHELGVASAPVPVKRLTVRRLADAFADALRPAIAARAAALGRDVATETGAEDAAAVIAGTLE